MIEGIDFSDSYAPTSDVDYFRIIIVLSSSKEYWLIFYDVSNTFQTNVIEDPSKSHYLRLQPLWPTHPLHSSCKDWKKLEVQTLRNLQETKYAGHELYQLLSNIFLNLGMIHNTMCKGVFVWKNIDGEETKHGYLILVTDNILLVTNATKASTLLDQEFDRYFAYTKRDSTEIFFLNFRIIQNEHGISLDQTIHILQKVIKPYFVTHEKVHFQSSPFPLANTFEMTLFNLIKDDSKLPLEVGLEN